MDKNLNLSSAANFESSVDNLGNLVRLSDVGLDHDGLHAQGLNILAHLLGALAAAITDVVDDNICAALGKEKGDTCTKATAFNLLALGRYEWDSLHAYREAPVTIAVLPVSSMPVKSGIFAFKWLGY
jgi:hypothetical protein